MWVWLSTAELQLLQHKLGTCNYVWGPEILIIFCLYSHHIVEFVTRCASVQTPSHVSSEIILAVSASRLCFVQVGPLKFMDRKETHLM